MLYNALGPRDSVTNSPHPYGAYVIIRRIDKPLLSVCVVLETLLSVLSILSLACVG